jgi:phytoene dehydrogenase-like protein
VLSPADLEGLNCNLVGGDIYAGSCALDQNLLWRPSGKAPGHKVRGIDKLWQIGASTHPGPGLGAGSGYLVAKQLLPWEPTSRAGKAAKSMRDTATRLLGGVGR